MAFNRFVEDADFQEAERVGLSLIFKTKYDA